MLVNRIDNLNYVWLVFRSQVRPQYFFLTILITVLIISLQVYYQPVYEVGKHLSHKNLPYLIQEIEDAEDASIPHSVPVVPRIVHFTWGAKPLMRFHNMLSMLSAYHILKPDKIIIWYYLARPSGQWWEYLMANVTSNYTIQSLFELRFRKDPTQIFGRLVRVAEHKSDIVRLAAIRHIGGIYLDTDVIVLKSFDRLLHHDCTMGLEEDQGAQCNGIIIGRANATFFNLWWEEYRTFNDGNWGHHSVKLPALLSEMYPKLCNILPESLHRPNWHELEFIYGGEKYDWRKRNYAMHLWFRFYNVDHDLESIKTLNSTYGEISRFVIYGVVDMF